MADDGGLLLNLAVEAPQAGKQSKQRENWRSKSFKKHARADAVRGLLWWLSDDVS
jgi:hypothetical protein